MTEEQLIEQAAKIIEKYDGQSWFTYKDIASAILSLFKQAGRKSPGEMENHVQKGTLDPEDIIEDGFGSMWSAFCPRCGEKSMSVVRPGKVQCNNCG